MNTPLFDSLPLYRQDLLSKHLDLVIEANKTLNLTRVDSREEGMVLHVEDSLIGLKSVLDSPAGLMADIGSGAGYPGIPLAIASERKCVLIDSREKKMKAVSDIIDELLLDKQIATYAGRAELFTRVDKRRFAVITARALAPIPVLLELSSPLLIRGGNLVCYKAQPDDEELDHASRIQKKLGMELVSDYSTALAGEYQRRILVYKKVSKPQIKLPRKEGEAQRNPLT